MLFYSLLGFCSLSNDIVLKLQDSNRYLRWIFPQVEDGQVVSENIKILILFSSLFLTSFHKKDFMQFTEIHTL